MTRIARPLRAMGAGVFTAPGGTPPVVVSGGAPLRGVEHRLEVASAQVKSCLLLAGLFAEGETWVREPAPSRDHTERMLEAAGVAAAARGRAPWACGARSRAIALPDIEVPGDFSSAAALLVAGALLGDPEVRLPGVNLNPRRTGLLDVMRRMGVDVREEPEPAVAGEPAGTLVVARCDDLRATEVAPEEVPAMIDELPLVGLLGAMAHGHHGRARGGRAAGEGERPHRLGGRRPARDAACAPTSARTASRCTARAGCRAATSRPWATTGWRCSARWRASPAARGCGRGASRPSASPTPASPATSPSWAAVPA